MTIVNMILVLERLVNALALMIVIANTYAVRIMLVTPMVI